MSYQPHASDELSANFTLNQTYDELSANFTLNQQSAELSANFRVHNIMAYFQHAVESTTGASFLTPSPIGNYVIRQANRDKIATIDVMYSNLSDRFSWVTPQSILQVFVGTNVDNKTKIFGGRVKEPEWQGENIIFHGQGYGEELLRRRITDAIYDIEATDLIKNHLLSGTSIATSAISFIGEETTRTSFHTDSYSDASNIESTSNVTLTGGTWDLDEATDPSDGDSWTENNYGDWDADADFTLSDEDTTVEVGSYSIKAVHQNVLFDDDFEGDSPPANPSNWTTVSEPSSTAVTTISSPVYEGSVACQLDDDSGSNACYIEKELGGTHTVGSLIFYWRKDSGQAGNIDCSVFGDSGFSIQWRDAGDLYYNAPEGGGWTQFYEGPLSDDQYYKFQFDYDCSTDTFDCYVDDTLRGDQLDFAADASNIDTLQITTEAGTTGKCQVDAVYWVAIGGTGNREVWYIDSKDLSLNLNQKVQIDFYIRQDDAGDDPVLRLYSSAGNFFYRTIAISSADTFENKTYDVGSGAAGWSETGSPDWTDIDWIAFYWASAQTTVTETYIDGLHFDQYETSGYIISNDLTTVSEASTSTQEYFDDVKIDVTKSEPDVSHYITIQACNDDGTTYETFTDNTWGTFTDHHSSASNHGRTFKYKILFTGDGSDSPELSAISIDVKSKLITVYDRIEYDNETLFDGIKDVLYDASLEGSTDTTGSYQLALVQDKTTTAFIPYLRQGYEILKEPTWRKDPKTLINYLKGRGADEGAIAKAEQDQWTEQDASSWSGTNMTISDESGSSYVKEGNYCIKAILEGTGFVDNCDDASIEGDYFDTYTESAGSVTEASGYIRTYGIYDDVAMVYFDENNYPLSGDYANYDISVDVWFGGGIFQPFCFFVDNPPQADHFNTLVASFDVLCVSALNELVLLKAQSPPFTYIYTGYYITAETWQTLRITRSGSTTTIYFEGNQIWSGTLINSDHDNIQFGISADNELDYQDLRLDNWNFCYEITGGNALSPSFNKNLDRYENLYCWYRTDGSDSFSIRLETDASNYFSRTLTPQKLNTAYELRLPVGSKSTGWSETSSPDWTDITQLRFVYGAGVNIATVFLDKLYFTIEPVATTYDDSDSQDEHGVYEGKTYVNKQITAIDELEDRLKTIVDASKNLNEPLDLVVYGRRDIATGDLVKVYFPKAGIDDVVFRVDEVHYLLGTMTLTRLFCRDIDTVSAANRLKKLDYETKQVK